LNPQYLSTIIYSRFFFILLSLTLVVLEGCGDKQRPAKNAPTEKGSPIRRDEVSILIAMDTLPNEQIKKQVVIEYKTLNKTPDAERNPFFHYWRARKFGIAKKKDSAAAEYRKMVGKKPYNEAELLKSYALLNLRVVPGTMVDANVIKNIFASLKLAEQKQSKLVIYFYDLLAKAYYQNGNNERALFFSNLYFKNHPYRNHPVLRQRYFDISFLLSARLKDYQKMALYNREARRYAIQIKDSMALARTYNNEAQFYGEQRQFKKSLQCSKIYYNYLRATNNLNGLAFNNLATSFNLNNQPDSAIYYYRKGIAFEQENTPGAKNSNFYKGLSDAYKRKANYKLAMEALDSAYLVDIQNIQTVEAVKVAEVNEKYQAEKKDRNIAELNTRNRLNETIIQQQRRTMWLIVLLFSSALSFFYTIYRQLRLRERNRLLKSENQRLNMEQKLLQSQLNPHFIFNAIANLQSLVASGHIQESVRYLRSFSGLLRGILEQNRKDFIEIEDEITSLNNYIQVQQMRYDGLFDYQITVDEQLDVHEILIPPMLVQPFVENAIEHGFRNINYKGLLKISFKLRDKSLVIEVNDNGAGLAQKPGDRPQKKSLAGIILKERFELLFTSRGMHAAFTINEKKGSGEKGVVVEIVIPIIID